MDSWFYYMQKTTKINKFYYAYILGTISHNMVTT